MDEPTAEDIAHELSRLACNHGCAIAAPRGMAPNGPCKHATFKPPDVGAWRDVRHALMLYRSLVKAQATALAAARAESAVEVAAILRVLTHPRFVSLDRFNYDPPYRVRLRGVPDFDGGDLLAVLAAAREELDRGE